MHLYRGGTTLTFYNRNKCMDKLHFLKFISPHVFDQSIQYLKRLIKIVASIDALKFRLLWAKYRYVHENISVMNMYHL